MSSEDPSSNRLYRVRFSRDGASNGSIVVYAWADSPEEAVRSVQVDGWPEGVATQVSKTEQLLRTGIELGTGLLGLVLGALLILLYFAAPMMALEYGSPMMATAASVLCLVLWIRVGPKPGPGFTQGMICLLGLGVLLTITAFLLALTLAVAFGLGS